MLPVGLGGLWPNSAGNLKRKHRYVILTPFPAKYPWDKGYVSPASSHWHISTTCLQPFAWCICFCTKPCPCPESSSQFFLCLHLWCPCLCCPFCFSCPPFLLFSFSSLLITCFSHTILQFRFHFHSLLNNWLPLQSLSLIRSLFCSALLIYWLLRSFCKWNNNPVCPKWNFSAS